MKRTTTGATALGGILLLLVVALAGACTAGNYVIPDCSVTGDTLDGDSCQQLNTDPKACQVYQCDTGTRQCALRDRDYDRDGDPDIACGGKDCDDRNPEVSGLRTGTCECSPDALKMSCYVGYGACKSAQVQYVCKSGALDCPAFPLAPQDYSSRPDAVNNSWDLNCDSKIESACCYQNANGSRLCEDCATKDCSKVAGLTAALAAKDPQRACELYCASFPDDGSKCPPDSSLRLVRCSADCGSDLALCYCHLNAGLPPLIPAKCERQSDKTPVLDKVNCR